MRLCSAAVLSLVISCCVFGQTYTIKAFAGGGLPVDIAGTSAILDSQGSVAVDGAGNLFFADRRHVVLREFEHGAKSRRRISQDEDH